MRGADNVVYFNEVPDVRDGFRWETIINAISSASAPGKLLMQVYLDESGDTGWTFSHPYRNGGSSRYLCLAFLFVPKIHRKITQKVIVDMYNDYGWKSEKKASSAAESQQLKFCEGMNECLSNHHDIKVDCIVVKKENVQDHIRKDPNKLYNFMTKMVIVDHVKDLLEFEFIPDKRSIKVESGNSLSDYLQTVLWFDCHSKVRVVHHPAESHRNYNLQFVDWISHCVWSHFEDGEANVFSEANKLIKVRRLFFDSHSLPLNQAIGS